MSINDGGPFHPGPWHNDSLTNATTADGQVVPPGFVVQMKGASLRDAFAMAALQGLLARDNPHATKADWAADAWSMADAMLHFRGSRAPTKLQELTEERIDFLAETTLKAMPGGLTAFCGTWGWRQFARALLADCAGHCYVPKPAPAAEPVNQQLLDTVRELHDVLSTSYPLHTVDEPKRAAALQRARNVLAAAERKV